MKDQRGSVTVIAVVMLLFLMIIAVAWLPMLTTEKTAAASDYREQQAWYAAEAGYKRAVAALENKNNDWGWITKDADIQTSNFLHLGLDRGKVDQEKIWYAVGIMKDGSDISGTSGTYTPEDNVAYQITSIGSCQGIRKVIRKVYTLGDNGESEGDEEPPEQQENIYLADALVTAGGAVSIFYANNEGKIYSNIHVTPIIENKVKYYVQDIVFTDSYYKNISNNVNEELKDGSKVGLGASYYKSAKITGGNNNISVAGNSVLLTKEDVYLDKMNINVEKGVLQIVANGKITIKNVKVTGAGQLTIIAKEQITIDSLTSDSKILIIGNNVVFNNPVVYKCFISSASGVTLYAPGDFVYEGQIQAAGAVAITGDQLKPQNFTLHFVDIAKWLIFPPMK